eukprot:11204389-Lingulodinium_polyedra.AAC.1
MCPATERTTASRVSPSRLPAVCGLGVLFHGPPMRRGPHRWGRVAGIRRLILLLGSVVHLVVSVLIT